MTRRRKEKGTEEGSVFVELQGWVVRRRKGIEGKDEDRERPHSSYHWTLEGREVEADQKEGGRASQLVVIC